MADVNISKYTTQVVRDGSKPASPGFVVSEGQSPTDPAGSGQNHLPVTIATASTGLAITDNQVLSGAGTVSQYIRGDGSLADFPSSTGGGASVNYYLNGSVSQGTIGGVAYKELNKTPVLGTGTDFSINANGYIASFITDAGDPNKLEIPAGNWNFETYFSASSSGGSPSFYIELYKYDGSTFTLIASSSSNPELIAFGTTVNAYFSTLSVPPTTLALTDRLAIRIYVTHSGRTITLHTEDNNLCQVITTFTTGLTALNGLTTQVQNFAVGTSGSDFNIVSSVDTHTFNLPTATSTIRGALSSSDWSTFNNKENAITAGTTAQYFRGDKTFQTLNTSVVPEGTNLYYTEARVNANTNVAANTAARHNAVTLGTANGLSLSTQVLSLGLASAGVTGALSGTDWSTFNSKQNALTNPVTGTGTTNYLAKFTGSTTVGNSQVFDNGTNVGIGTASPGVRLEISSGTEILRLRTNNSDNYFTYFNSSGSQVGDIGYDGRDTNILSIWNGVGGILLGANGSERARITSGGNLLVGTTTDSGFKLDVNGTGRFSGISEVFKISGGGTSTMYQTFTNSGGNYYIGISSSTGTGLVGGASAYAMAIVTESARDLILATNNTARATITSGGNVGIGTTSPAAGYDNGNGSLTLQNAKSIAFQNSSNGWNTSTTGGAITYFTDNNLYIDAKDSASNILFRVNGATERFRISSNGFVSAGATTNGRLGVRGFTNDSSGYAFEAANSSGNTLFIVRNDGVSTFTGNVGIGTTSPQVAGGGFTGLHINGSGNGASLVLSTAGTNLTYLYTLGTGGVDFAIENSGAQIFRPGGSERMRITSGGNVLIGTTTAQSGTKLQVAGVMDVWSSSNTLLRFNHDGTRGLIETFTGGGYSTTAINPNGGNVLIGTTTDNGAKLNVNGTIRTANPTGSTSDGWLLGRALVSGSSTPDRWIRVQIGNLYYDILSRYIGSV